MFGKAQQVGKAKGGRDRKGLRAGKAQEVGRPGVQEMKKGKMVGMAQEVGKVKGERGGKG